MRLPLRTFPLPFCFAVLVMVSVAAPARADDAAQRALRHKDPQWLAMTAVLPDPATAPAAKLEVIGDVLRARRLPEDALDYYTYALQRGGDEARLLNKLGVTHLELQQNDVARAYFSREVKLYKKDAEGWNNLGAVEHINGRFRNAIVDYNKAVKLNRKSAVYHSNLGTAYYEMNDYESGSREYDKALRLDPGVLEHSGLSGMTAHVMGHGDRGRFHFEMAKLYANQGDEMRMMHALEVACESGFDIGAEMNRYPTLAAFRRDPRVIVMIKNAKNLKKGDSVASVTTVPGLKPATP